MNSNDTPPRIPYRCGTIMQGMSDAEFRRFMYGTQKMEQEFIDWVRAHPDPRAAWVKSAEDLEHRLAYVERIVPTEDELEDWRRQDEITAEILSGKRPMPSSWIYRVGPGGGVLPPERD